MLAKVIVSLAGVLLIAAVNWYFLGDLLRRPGPGKGASRHGSQ